MGVVRQVITIAFVMLDVMLVLVFIPLSLFSCSAETHWVITEQGRIEAVTDSLLHMSQPHGLVQFLRQDDDVRQGKEDDKILNEQKKTLDIYENFDDPNIENKLLSEDSDCINSGKPLPEQDLFISTIVPFSELDQEFSPFDKRGGSEFPKDVPVCTDHYPLPFSMSSMDHLKAMQNRNDIVGVPEVSLIANVVNGIWDNISDFGHHVSEALRNEPQSWQLYNFATIYWRINGEAKQALECVRRGLHLSPPNKQHIALLNLANILHQANRSQEAAQVVETAIGAYSESARLYFTAAQIYAVNFNFNESVKAFENCLRLDPVYPNAEDQRAAVACHMKLELALTAQHSNLQNTLSELQSFQSKLKGYNLLQDRLVQHAVHPSLRHQASLTYDYFTYGDLEGVSCDYVTEGQQAQLECRVLNQLVYDNSKNRKLGEIRRRSAVLQENFAEEATDDGLSLDSSGERYGEMSAKDANSASDPFFIALEANRGMNESRPPLPHKYEHVDHPIPVSNQWPSRDQCVSAELLAVEDMPPIFVSPDSKGFQTKRLLTELISLPSGSQHPLPWYPPFCGSFTTAEKDFYLNCCDHLLGVQALKSIDKVKGTEEANLHNILMDLISSSSDSIVEVGQRIHTLLKYNIGPRWLVFGLAAAYWRRIGNSNEAVQCLRFALREYPPGSGPGAEMALTQLGWLTYLSGGRVNDATALIRQASEIDTLEPVAHFLLSWLLAKREQWDVAESNALATLKLEPEFPAVREILKYIRCRRRFPMKNQQSRNKMGLQRTQPTACSGHPITSPRFFCLTSEKGEERCYLEEKVVNGSENDELPSHIQLGTIPTCIKSPPLASLLLPRHATPERQELPCNLGKCIYRDLEEVAIKIKTTEMAGFEAAASEEDPMELILVDASYVPSPPRFNIESASPRELLESFEEYFLSSKNVELENAWGQQGPKKQPTVTKEELVLKGGVKITVQKPDSRVEENNELHDDPMPEIIPMPPEHMMKAGMQFLTIPASKTECEFWKKKVSLGLATSTWLALSAKGIRNVENFISFKGDVKQFLNVKPVCPIGEVGGLLTMDHLPAYQNLDSLKLYKPEQGLKDAFLSLAPYGRETYEELGTRIALSMKPWIAGGKVPPEEVMEASFLIDWPITYIAALYWRIQGNATMAIQCLRHALYYAPSGNRDLPLIGLANVYHQSGYLTSGVISAGAALAISPRFVVVHFTLANIYASKGDYDRAAMFYYSTLALQNTFEPAKERLRAIYCIHGRLPEIIPEEFN